MTRTAFTTDTGLRVPAVTTDQMREIDRIAIEEVGPNLFQMMENAGRSLAETVIETSGSGWRTDPVVVLAGTGGNGGGGICAARHLANHGADVAVIITDPARLSEAAAWNLHLFRGTRGRLIGPGDLASFEAGVVVDAVVGYSLSGPLRGIAAEIVAWVGEQHGRVVSLDVPSGIDATSGDFNGVHVSANTTLTLALPKSGLDVAAVGDLWLADIGIPVEVYDRAGVPVSGDLFGSGFRIRLS